jgi:hypothetical protein
MSIENRKLSIVAAGFIRVTWVHEQEYIAKNSGRNFLAEAQSSQRKTENVMG